MMGYEEAFLDVEKCRWNEGGYCQNPEARMTGELCDIDPHDCMEDGFEWEG